MSVPFTYLVYHIPTNLSYYGVRYGRNCCPSSLWTSYFTSSKLVHKLIEEYGKDSFIYEVRRTFSTAKEALSWEEKVLRRIDRKSGKWLNIHHMSNTCIVTSETAKIQARINWSSNSYIQSQRDSQKETWANTELREMHSVIMKRTWTPERRLKHSEIAKLQWQKQDRIAIGNKISKTKKSKS